MVRPAVRRKYEVVDLTADDEDDDLTDDGSHLQDVQSAAEPTDDGEEFDFDHIPHNYYQDVEINNGGTVVDLNAIPDVDVPPSDFNDMVMENAARDEGVDDAQPITEAACLQLVLDVFPDVSISHVLSLIRKKTTDQTRTKLHSERIVNDLLEGTYPKETDSTSKKRRRADSAEASDYEKDGRESGDATYVTDA